VLEFLDYHLYRTMWDSAPILGTASIFLWVRELWREFFSSPPHLPRLWGPPSLLPNGYQELFSWGKAGGAWSWQLTSI